MLPTRPHDVLFPNPFLLDLVAIEKARPHILLWSYGYQKKAVTVLLLRHQGNFHQATNFEGTRAGDGIFRGLQVVVAAMSCAQAQSSRVQYAFSSISTQQFFVSPYRTLYWQYTQPNIFLGEDNENLALVISPQKTHLNTS